MAPGRGALTRGTVLLLLALLPLASRGQAPGTSVAELEAELRQLRADHAALQRQLAALRQEQKRSALGNSGWRDWERVDRATMMAEVAWNLPRIRGPKEGILLAHPAAAAGSGEVRANSTLLSRCKEVDLVMVHTVERRNCLFIAETNGDSQSDRMHRYFPAEAGAQHRWYPVSHRSSGKAPLRYSDNVHRSSQIDLANTIRDLDEIGRELGPLLAQGNANKAPVIVMVVNAGQSDLLVNFFCSAQRHGIDVTRHVIFASSADLHKKLKSLGLRSFFNAKVGEFPENAAAAYGDRTFHKMMHLKTLAPYLVSRMGYPVLFQDADLVWFKDAVDYFVNKADKNADVFFMDDGARSRRFSPYFANSGFFFSWAGIKSTLFHWEVVLQGEYYLRGTTSSHQEVIQRALIDLEGRLGLVSQTLDIFDFISGQQYHRNKTYMVEIKAKRKVPMLFHWCWTLSRVEKLEYMREMMMWYIKPSYELGLDIEANKYLADNPTVRKPALPKKFFGANLNWPAIESAGVSHWTQVCELDPSKTI